MTFWNYRFISEHCIAKSLPLFDSECFFSKKRAALWCLSTFKNNNSVTCLFYSTNIIRILSSVWCIKALLCCAAVIKCENNARARRRFSRFGGNSIDQLATASRKLVITCRETVSSLSSIVVTRRPLLRQVVHWYQKFNLINK